MTEATTVTIGGVTDLLKEEFPDVTMSKVRFLETQGLINPARSASGYRQFAAADIRRLEYILRQQRDHFLPLKVIKSKLARWQGDEASRASGATSGKEGVPLDTHEETFELHELARRTELSTTDLRQLVAHGLLTPHDEDEAPTFGIRDAAIAHQCRILMRQGLEPRHLRVVRHAVARQAALLGGLTVALRRSRSPDARLQATETLESGAEAMMRLTDLLFSAEVRTILDED